MPLIETRGTASSRALGQFAQSLANNYIEDLFSTYLYTGNGSTQTITNGINLSGKGGLVWIKQRPSTAVSGGFPSVHTWFDTVRGSGKAIASNNQDVQNTSAATLQSFGSSGFTVTQFTSNGSPSARPYEANYNGVTYASWSFREEPKFFDVVTYTGNANPGRTISHALNSVPGFIIVKNLTTASNWTVWHRSNGDGYAYLDQTQQFVSGGGIFWGDGSVYTAPTSTVFTVSSDAQVNASGNQYIAYLFAHNAGGFGASGTENAISCGSYTGNGSTSGTVVTLGYEPQWVMIKCGSFSGSWQIMDSARGMVVGSADATLQANNANAEGSNNYISPTSTGFQLTSTSIEVNSISQTYYYIAIRRGPMRTPTSGTSVYTGVTQASLSEYSVGFPADMVMASVRSGDGLNALVSDRLRGKTAWLTSSSTAAEATYSPYIFDFNTSQNGIIPNVSTSSSIYWNFRRAPGFFDVVCYTGTGANLTITHNLGAVPQMMWVKTRTGIFLWGVYDSFNGATNFMRLNGDQNSSAAANYFNNTAPTSSVFTVGTALSTVSENYVAYLFGSVSGVSKFGNYTGTGTTKQIDCGFTGGARFVLIKRTDTNGDWYVWDTARGIVAGNDPYLLLNSAAAEVTATDYIDTLSSGFEISSTAPAAINGSGGTFIYLAIA